MNTTILNGFRSADGRLPYYPQPYAAELAEYVAEHGSESIRDPEARAILLTLIWQSWGEDVVKLDTQAEALRVGAALDNVISLPPQIEIAEDLNSYFRDLWDFASKRPQSETRSLQQSIDHIARIGKNYPDLPCRLYKDFAPHSFGWCAGGLVGGCIYHGAHDGGGGGGAPTFAVCLEAAEGWRLHT